MDTASYFTSAIFWLAGLAILLPVVIYTPLSAALKKKARLLDSNEVLGLSIVTSLIIFIFLLKPGFAPFQSLSLQLLLGLAFLLAWLEKSYQLGTQPTILCRFILIILCSICGFGFQLSPAITLINGPITTLAELLLSTLFYSGLILTFQFFDRLRTMASGVGMIISVLLYGLTIRWGGDIWSTMLLVSGGLFLGTLLIQHKRRRVLGRMVTMPMAILLSAATIESRSWGMTLPLLILPLLAALIPMIERVHLGLLTFMEGDSLGERPDHLRSLFLETGMGDRWAVFYVWILTTQFGVIFCLAYETASVLSAVAAFASFVLPLLFTAVFLSRIGEKLQKKKKPDNISILFLSHYFYPEVNAPASRLHDHAKLWAAEGHEVTVVCPVPNAPAGRLYKGYMNHFWQEEKLDGIRVIRVWTFLAANRGRFRRCINYLSFMTSSLFALCLIRRHDVMIATTPQFFCGLAGAIGSLFRREPFILEVRDLWPESIAAVGAGGKGVVLRFIAQLAQWMYNRAERLVTVGQGYADELTNRYQIDPKRLTIIPNGIDCVAFEGLEERNVDYLTPFGITEGDFVVAYVGTVGMAHRLQVILDAARMTRDNDRIHYVVVGDGAQKEELERCAEEQGLSQVHFTGVVKKESLGNLMKACDVFLVHLRRCDLFKTVLPSKLFEAMGASRPVILGVEGQARAILEQAGAGLAITPESGEGLANAARQLANDRELASAMGARGAAFVRSHFTRDRFASDYITAMTALLEERNLVESRSRTQDSAELVATEPEREPDSAPTHLN